MLSSLRKYKVGFFLFISLLFLLLISYSNYQKTHSFSFVDEFDHFVAAKFMLDGKILFSEIFHNRQFGPVYISYIIQEVFQPNSLYRLVLYHRLFVLAFSFVGAVLLALRFGISSALAALAIEAVRYFSFGNLFIGESLIIYPVLYLFVAAWHSVAKKGLYFLDYVVIGLLAFFIIFMRETFIPLTFFLLLIIICYAKKYRYIAPVITIVFSMFFISTVQLKHFIFNIIVVNSSGAFSGELNIWKTFFYPIYLLISGEFTILKIFLLFFNVTFLILAIHQIKNAKSQKQIFLVFLILALAAVRPTEPGSLFYGAYKMLIWNAILIQVSLLLLSEVKGKIKALSTFLVTLAFVYIIASPQSIMNQKTYKLTEFDIAYNQYSTPGQIIKKLANSRDLLFVDGYGSLIYWEGNISSSYKYSLFYPVNQKLDYYSKERLRMFDKNPPAFYAWDCISRDSLFIPKLYESKYINLRSGGKSTCLYMREDRAREITDAQKNELSKFGYTL